MRKMFVFLLFIVVFESNAYAIPINFLSDPLVASISTSAGVEISADGKSITILATGNEEWVSLLFNFESTSEPESVKATYDYEWLPTYVGEDAFSAGFSEDDSVYGWSGPSTGTLSTSVYGFYDSPLQWFALSYYNTGGEFLVISNLDVTGPFSSNPLPTPEPTTILLLGPSVIAFLFRKK